MTQAGHRLEWLVDTGEGLVLDNSRIICAQGQKTKQARVWTGQPWMKKTFISRLTLEMCTSLGLTSRPIGFCFEYFLCFMRHLLCAVGFKSVLLKSPVLAALKWLRESRCTFQCLVERNLLCFVEGETNSRSSSPKGLFDVTLVSLQSCARGNLLRVWCNILCRVVTQERIQQFHTTTVRSFFENQTRKMRWANNQPSPHHVRPPLSPWCFGCCFVACCYWVTSEKK